MLYSKALLCCLRGARHAHQLRAVAVAVAATTATHAYNNLLRLASDHRQLLRAYRAMLRAGVVPDHFTFPFALKVLAQMPHSPLRALQCLHAQAAKSGHTADVYVASSLVHAYASRADAASARAVFDSARHRNVVTWTAMIAGHVEAGEGREAVALFKEIVASGCEVNYVTVLQVMAACAQCSDLDSGKWVHAMLQHWGVEPVSAHVVLATAVLDMYARCGGLEVAWELFDAMPQKNGVSWNAMVEVCSRHGRPDNVLQVFESMLAAGIMPDKVTWLSILRACTSKGAMCLGRALHAYMEKTIGCQNIVVCTSLMDMYSKIGNAQNALQIFHCLNRKDLMAWTSMIVGLAKHGHGKDAVRLFNQMEHGGVVPDHVTFVGVLTACNHAGMVDEGKKYFDSMRNLYGIRPTIKHYGCMIDLLSRAGHLAEAEGIIQSIPIQPSITIWGTMLNGCKIHGRADVAERIGKHVTELNPQCSEIYVILSNIYATVGQWHAVEQTRSLMWRTGLKKSLGSSGT